MATLSEESPRLRTLFGAYLKQDYDTIAEAPDGVLCFYATNEAPEVVRELIAEPELAAALGRSGRDLDAILMEFGGLSFAEEGTGSVGTLAQYSQVLSSALVELRF